MSELQNVLKKMKLKGDKESTIDFLKTVARLLPPSDDYGISLTKKGVHEYVLDRRGVVIISLSLEEYLPIFSADSKRIEYNEIPEDVIKVIKTNWKQILGQLRDYLLEYSKIDKKYLEVADQVNSVIFENI
ncbi:hypothetical protein [Sulfolobus acidocaldarius]|uniref:Conserved protein n=4 Tax=Sulfolobus acidocaldarius TaxID=2285 RepID=Q4JCB2_SULAC|nr:hypothetical protein [Sulfolobus acidocaldarius]AHC50662.1 hypothetical protein SUSAZ_00735 [Sulfolobus acidocaldarius SUSAZ]AAY79567.1 conserved protein [Sulfolobus acidocaldarius DSM 639]AGE70120.1 hypothetical protein SacN8_00695 [Sulfolobus acidocaldarius N8]AGE72395.1 hypothetical protein SacRon12I_00695 [Sulfolobus acidocaldarius Ron12/I]ALU29465.1 hypothetical protein ATY89_05555 [Sulfolobus acidocaldarius]